MEELESSVDGRLVVDEYQKTGGLTRFGRTKLVQLAVNVLIQRCGTQWVALLIRQLHNLLFFEAILLGLF